MGRSNPEEEVCRQTPKSAEPVKWSKNKNIKQVAGRKNTKGNWRQVSYQEEVDNPQLTATWYEMPHVWGLTSLFSLHTFPFQDLYLNEHSKILRKGPCIKLMLLGQTETLPVMMNNNLGYKYCFPSEISFQRTPSSVESFSSNRAATRLSYITAASNRIPKSSSGVLERGYPLE